MVDRSIFPGPITPKTDALGVFFICFTAFYTGMLAFGLGLLYYQRKSAAVRIRGFWNICSSVLFLHVYVMLVLLGYPFKGAFMSNCAIEYWVMGTLFPFGIAMFQVSNIRLRSYYEGQTEISDAGYLQEKRKKAPQPQRSFLGLWKRLTVVQKTYVGIGVGMVIQTTVTFVLYFGSRRFHGSYGFFSSYIDELSCHRGVEWIPTTAWQFLWSYAFGPWVLLKIRHIKDGHNWALQTRLAIIAGLPGTPLWLAFVYSPDPRLAKINNYLVPPAWFLPGLFAMEIVSICFPIYDAIRDMQIRLRRLSATPNQDQQNESYSMGSLEMQISKNIDPLLRWAAHTEFTAENVVFLREVRDFKKKWTDISRHGPLSEDQRREQYEDAALIYFTLVNPLTAKFNINIDHRTYLALKEVFNGVRYAPYQDETSSKSSKSDNVITPWDDYDSTPSLALSDTSTDSKSGSDIEKLYPLPVAEIKVGGDGQEQLADPLLSLIPKHFSIDIFDKAYEVVKQDVFLNTWPKYEARYARPRPSTGSLPSEASHDRERSPAMADRSSAGFWSRMSWGGK